MTTYAIDCDLHKTYCVADDGRVVCKASPVLTGVELAHGDTLLYEIASPMDYTPDGNKGIAYNKRRWTIWNVAQAVQLDNDILASALMVEANLLVSPSSKWTRGYELLARHKLAGCKLGEKNLRECEAMLWFYKHRPADWIPLEQFLAEI